MNGREENLEENILISTDRMNFQPAGQQGASLADPAGWSKR
jgi:hypothetical protein